MSNFIKGLIWLIILVFISLPVASFCSGFYILLLPLTACVNDLKVIMHFMTMIVKVMSHVNRFSAHYGSAFTRVTVSVLLCHSNDVWSFANRLSSYMKHPNLKVKKQFISSQWKCINSRILVSWLTYFFCTMNCY